MRLQRLWKRCQRCRRWREEKKKRSEKQQKQMKHLIFFPRLLLSATIQSDHRFVRVSSFGFSSQSAILYCVWTMLCEFANCVSVTIYLVLCLLYYSLASSAQFIRDRENWKRFGAHQFANMYKSVSLFLWFWFHQPIRDACMSHYVVVGRTIDWMNVNCAHANNCSWFIPLKLGIVARFSWPSPTNVLHQ